MQLAIHSNRQNVMNVVDATSISNQNAFDASSRNFAQIKTKLNTKMNKIKKFYESKEKNLSKMISWTMMTKFFDKIRDATRHECANETKKMNDCVEKQITRLKKMIKKLKRMIEKTKNTIEESIWTKMTVKQSKIAISTFFLREINVFSKRKSNKEMKLMTWIKKEQEIKRMQRMSATEMITLTCESNIKNTLIVRKNIVEIKRFKKLMIFKIIFEESKKILKFNDFWIRDVVSTTILRREKSEIIIHEIKVKNMFQNIKNNETKMMKKIDEIMHSRLQIKSVK